MCPVLVRVRKNCARSTLGAGLSDFFVVALIFLLGGIETYGLLGVFLEPAVGAMVI